jgi:LysR family transcriptional activator of mexEF-oprN operon
MNKIDLRAIDLNLLTVFRALMQERHVSRAADRLRLGQSAVSHALSRLRALTGDDLFVRAGRLMEPTERALTLMAGLSPALEQIERTFRGTQAFDPTTASPTFRIGLTDDLQIAILPKLIRLLRSGIPHARLITRTADYRTAPDLLDRGDITTAMAFLPKLPSSAKTRTVGTIRYRVLRGDPDRRPLTLDAYCARPHVLVTYAGDLRGFIDDHLDQRGRTRHVAFSVPQFGTLPAVLKDTDFIATVPDYVATTLAAQGGLRADPIPFESPSYVLSLGWRLVADKDPAEVWLRKALQTAVGRRPG